MSVFVLIPAAGMGRRMGATVNKQYLPLNGRPILGHTIALFDKHPLIDKIYVITPADESELCRREVLAPGNFRKVQDLVPGGAERQDSVRNGLQACAAAPDDIVLIHDGVRPLLQPGLIDKLVAEVQERGACLVGVPVKDTIKQVVDGRIEGTPDRNGLWQAQTPQAFRYGQILEAYQRAQLDGFRGTDDASLVERLGQPVTIIAGSYRNIKLTTPEDLLLARAFLDSPEEVCP
jgi:2-C-methyl-D-erythritol 4-phosphate cytidylyltransferase